MSEEELERIRDEFASLPISLDDTILWRVFLEKHGLNLLAEIDRLRAENADLREQIEWLRNPTYKSVPFTAVPVGGTSRENPA